MVVRAAVYTDDGGMVSCAMDGGESCRRALADEDAFMDASSSSSSSSDSESSAACMISSSSSASSSSSSLSSGRANAAEDEEGRNGNDCET